MRKAILLSTAAAGIAIAAGLAAHADSARNVLAFAMSGEAGKPGVNGQITTVKMDGKLYDYCTRVIDDAMTGKPTDASPGFAAGDCVEIFIAADGPGRMAAATQAEPGQPGRGGDGASLPGAPGGKGGAAGVPGGAPGAARGPAQKDADADDDVDEALLNYCSDVLKQTRPDSTSRKPVRSDEYSPSDCADFFASLEDGEGNDAAPAGKAAARSTRDGGDGASIAGGQGGEGGKRGAGPGGGAGGKGGAGIAGGSGGKGGAGGSGY